MNFKQKFLQNQLYTSHVLLINKIKNLINDTQSKLKNKPKAAVFFAHTLIQLSWEFSDTQSKKIKKRKEKNQRVIEILFNFVI